MLCVRLVILDLAAPLFVMAALVEARSTMLPLALLPWSLYLALPFSVSPLLVLPCAALLALSVNFTTASFKKYL